MGPSVLSDTHDSDREATTGPKIRLIPNSIVKVDGRECVVERRLGNLWQLLTLDREPLHYSDADLVALMAEGKFFVVSQPGADRTRPEPLHPLNVGETAHAKNMRKLEYVMACKQHPDYCRSREVLNPIIEAFEERLKKDKMFGGYKRPGLGLRICLKQPLWQISIMDAFAIGVAAGSGR